jgi:hypothetical protein
LDDAIEWPPAQTVMRDEKRNIEYTIHAYRPITREEAVLSVKVFLSSQKAKPRKGSRPHIIGVLGHDE